MDAKVQRIMWTAGPVIGSSKMVGTSKCVYHPRLKGLLHDLVHGSVCRGNRAGERSVRSITDAEPMSILTPMTIQPSLVASQIDRNGGES